MTEDQATGKRSQKTSQRRRAERTELRFKEAMYRLRTTDPDAYRAISSHITRYKSIADNWRNIATTAESRLAVLEAHIDIQNAKENQT